MTREGSGYMNRKWYWNLSLRDSELNSYFEWGKEKLVADLGKEDNALKVFFFFKNWSSKKKVVF